MTECTYAHPYMYMYMTVYMYITCHTQTHTHVHTQLNTLEHTIRQTTTSIIRFRDKPKIACNTECPSNPCDQLFRYQQGHSLGYQQTTRTVYVGDTKVYKAGYISIV